MAQEQERRWFISFVDELSEFTTDMTAYLVTRMAMQTTGTFPQLTTKQPKPKGKGGGKGKGKC